MAEPTQKEPRGPTNLRIKFRSANLEQFIERYAVDVSRGGIFIRTKEPLSVGTRLKLEFQLLDAAPLLAGEGTVVWIREPDPMRQNVTPGMGVRFDKLTPDSQPTLEKILAEKTRLQQSGVAPTGLTKSGGGMAVRRTSGIFPAVDPANFAKPAAAGGLVRPPLPAELGRPSSPDLARSPADLAGPPTNLAKPAADPARPAADLAKPAPLAKVPATPPSAPTGSGEPMPISGAPRSSSPFVSVSKTTFMGSRTATPVAPAGPGAEGRPRSKTGSGVRPAPVASAVFEPPTADDIDKALEALHETSGSHESPSPEAQPAAVAEAPIEAPHLVADDVSNDPTRVVDVVEELVGGSAARPPATPKGASEPAQTAASQSEAHEHPPAVSAAALDGPIGADALGSRSGEPSSGEATSDQARSDQARSDQAGSSEPATARLRPRLPGAGGSGRPGGVPGRPVAAERSTRFRAASAAYPTLRRRKLTLFGVGIIVVGAVLIVGVLKLHWKERIFPAPPTPPAQAPVVEAPPPAAPAAAAPAPTADNAAPAASAPAAPEGAGGAAAKADLPAPAPLPKSEGPSQEKPAPAISGKPSEKVATKPAEAPEPAPAADDHPAVKHGAIHRRPHTASGGAETTGETKASGAESAASADSSPGAKASDKSGNDKAADQVAVAEEKSAADKSAAAATSPTEAAAAPTPPPPVIKITSTPAGAEVLIDGTSVGYTPFTSKAVDPGAPHAITVKKDGYEPTERMIGGLDWSRPHGNSPPSLKFSVKLRRSAASAGGSSPKGNGQPTDDPGGPYIKEIKPDAP